MATSSILGGTRAPRRAAGNDSNALGPSDNSDSGSDVQGAYGSDELASDSDAVGTGERATAGGGMERPDADIMPDHIERLSGELLEDDVAAKAVALALADLANDEDDQAV